MKLRQFDLENFIIFPHTPKQIKLFILLTKILFFSLQFLQAALDTPRDYEEFDIWLELKSDNDIQRLNSLYQLHGANVTKLSWSNWSRVEISNAQVVELLNKLPNLENLKLSSWNTEFTGNASGLSLTLPKLTALEVSECGNFIFDFLAATLPENSLKNLKVDNVNEVDAKFSSFIAKQSTIKELNIRGDFMTIEPLKNLQLESLRCIIYQKDDQTSQQKEFLKSLVKSQSGLKELDLLNDSDYSFSFVDDAMFKDICALSKLEKLLISIDGISADGIKSISSLSALKSLQLKTNRESSLAAFKELSGQKNSSLQDLVLNTWSFDIPTETYEALGQNNPNLKSLKITLGTRHSINFYAKAFPNLERLSVKFGEANNRMEFGQAFDANDNFTQSKLKKIKLNFWGSEATNGTAFAKMLGMFTNLERIEIQTKFEFKADLINQIAANLNNIKEIKLLQFAVHNNETFPADTIEALKSLRSKVNFVSLVLSNVQNVNFGPERMEEGDVEDRSFTFQPLINALKDVYRVKSSGFSNIRIHNNLELIAGCEKYECAE